MHTSLHIEKASGFWRRFKGLMLSRPLPPNTALLIPRCASVHTCFMRFCLDIVYLDQRGRVVKCVRGVKPWRLSWGGRGAVHTLELAAGSIALHGIEQGDMVPDLPEEAVKHATRTLA